MKTFTYPSKLRNEIDPGLATQAFLWDDESLKHDNLISKYPYPRHRDSARDPLIGHRLRRAFQFNHLALGRQAKIANIDTLHDPGQPASESDQFVTTE